MSRNPFAADPAVPSRLAKQDAEALRAAAAPLIRDLALPAADAEALGRRFGVGDDDLLLHLLPLAQARARPPVSSFRVGAAGRTDSGDVLLGHNVEARGAALAHTIHGEGFVAMRAFARGQSLERLALGEAHPCAHCRQVLSEFADAPALVLIDPLGHRLTLADLYPWPFDPAYLGQSGAAPGTGPALHLTGDVPQEVRSALEAAGRRAHAPYSGNPAAVAVEAPEGTFAGGSIESVAFNPTLTPLQSALVALLAAGADPSSIRRAWLAQAPGGAVDLVPATRELLSALAPGATLELLAWA